MASVPDYYTQTILSCIPQQIPLSPDKDIYLIVSNIALFSYASNLISFENVKYEECSLIISSANLSRLVSRHYSSCDCISRDVSAFITFQSRKLISLNQL